MTSLLLDFDCPFPLQGFLFERFKGRRHFFQQVSREVRIFLCLIDDIAPVLALVFINEVMQNPFTHKTYLDVSDDEFKKDRIWLVNSECHKSYFGLEENNREEFESVLRVAQANLDASRFPDFTFESGFIEHFQVTSSLTTRKGATHTRKESEFCRTVDVETKEIEGEWNGTPSFDTDRAYKPVFVH